MLRGIKWENCNYFLYPKIRFFVDDIEKTCTKCSEIGVEVKTVLIIVFGYIKRIFECICQSISLGHNPALQFKRKRCCEKDTKWHAGGGLTNFHL